MAARAVKALDHGLEVEGDPVGLMVVVEEARQVAPRHPGQQPVLALDHHRLGPQGPG